MDSLPINVTDLAIVAILVLSAAIAVVRGFSHEALSVGAWVGAAVATLYAFPYASPYTRQIISIELIADIVTGVVVFLVVLIALAIVSRLLARQVQRSSLSPLDRSLGLVFGLVRGVVIVVLVWMLMSWAVPVKERPSWLQDARSRPLLDHMTQMAWRLVPEDLQREGESAVDQATEDLENLKGAKDSIDRLSSPPAAPEQNGDQNGGASDGEAGYKDEQRQDMDRVIEGVQSGSPSN